MILNGTEYKLIYLDTNALRAIIYNENGCGKGFFEKFIIEGANFIPCFSYDNIREIRPNNERYKLITGFFAQIPCFMFYHYRILLQEEHIAYKENKVFSLNSITMRAFSPMGLDDGYDFRIFIEQTDAFLEEQLNREKEELALVVYEWELKRADFANLKIETDKQKEDLFIALEKPTVIKDLLGENIELKNSDDFMRFPSLRMVEFSLFQRAHLTKKPLKLNDVMDCMISAFTPYVDAIITEGFQANICKKAKKHIPEMKKLQIYTLRDIKNA